MTDARMKPTLSECIIYSGFINSQGYGRVRLPNGHTRAAHVVAWERANGDVPTGKQLDHLCRNRACINVAHLEPVTSRENTLRGIGPTAENAKKSSCIHGHNLNDAYVDKRGRRLCRECQRERRRAYTLKNKELLRAKARDYWHKKTAIAKVEGKEP